MSDPDLLDDFLDLYRKSLHIMCALTFSTDSSNNWVDSQDEQFKGSHLTLHYLPLNNDVWDSGGRATMRFTGLRDGGAGPLLEAARDGIATAQEQLLASARLSDECKHSSCRHHNTEEPLVGPDATFASVMNITTDLHVETGGIQYDFVIQGYSTSSHMSWYADLLPQWSQDTPRGPSLIDADSGDESDYVDEDNTGDYRP